MAGGKNGGEREARAMAGAGPLKQSQLGGANPVGAGASVRRRRWRRGPGMVRAKRWADQGQAQRRDEPRRCRQVQRGERRRGGAAEAWPQWRGEDEPAGFRHARGRGRGLSPRRWRKPARGVMWSAPAEAGPVRERRQQQRADGCAKSTEPAGTRRIDEPAGARGNDETPAMTMAVMDTHQWMDGILPSGCACSYSD